LIFSKSVSIIIANKAGVGRLFKNEWATVTDRLLWQWNLRHIPEYVGG
jgi:hypothetical protein